jgi:hypothetical protein
VVHRLSTPKSSSDANQSSVRQEDREWIYLVTMGKHRALDEAATGDVDAEVELVVTVVVVVVAGRKWWRAWSSP